MIFAIFLDIDGVLNSHKTCVGTSGGHFGVTDNRLRILSGVAGQYRKHGDTVKIILTSDWKLMSEKAEDYRYLVARLQEYGLSIDDKTTDDGYRNRGEGVALYLKNHLEIDEFVILDDNEFDFEDYPKLWENFLHTKNKVTLDEGIDEAHFASETPSVAAIIFHDYIQEVIS